MFPGPGAQIIRNEVGEPLGWDYPSDDEPYDDREEADREWQYEQDENESSKEGEMENTFDDQVTVTVTIRGWIVSDTPGYTPEDAKQTLTDDIADAIGAAGMSIVHDG